MEDMILAEDDSPVTKVISHMKGCEIIWAVFSLLFLSDTNGVCQSAGDPHAKSLSVQNIQPFIKKQFNPPGLTLDPVLYASDKTNGYLLAGQYSVPGIDTFNSRSTCFIHIDENGCVNWSKSLTRGNVQVVQSITATSDAGFLVTLFPNQPQSENYPGALMVFKLDKLGNVVWSRSYDSGGSVNNYLSAVVETSDKGFVIEIGSFQDGINPSFISVTKIDQQGNFIWGRKLAMENNAAYNIGGIVEKNGSIYTTGSIYDGASLNNLLLSFFVQLNGTTGAVNWTKQNDPVQSAIRLTDLHVYKNGLLLNSTSPNELTTLIYTNDNGQVITARLITNPYAFLSEAQNITVTPGNGVYFHQSSGNSPVTKKDVIMQLDSNLQILWQFNFYSQDQRFAGWYQLTGAPDGGVAGIGSGQSLNGLKTLTFLRLDSAGSACNSGKSALDISPADISLVPMTWTTNVDLSMTVTNMLQTLVNLPVESHLFCPEYAGSEPPVPVIHLPADTTFCLSNNMFLDAGNGYIGYHWQDGSSSQSINIHNPGTYQVTLTDFSGCTITETTTVKAIVPLPTQFLPADTVVCTGDRLLLKSAVSYVSYLWNTGETSSSITVSNSGYYSLKVTDRNGCIGTDTTRVISKECSFSIYFPNAFTPGKMPPNDLFRPVVAGTPVVYHFSIYSRWGQRVFETIDPSKGWDGKINGVDQPTGVYVWTCTSQFRNEKQNSQKGNFTLIR